MRFLIFVFSFMKELKGGKTFAKVSSVYLWIMKTFSIRSLALIRCMCHTAWVCWFKLGWVCRFRKHHTALPIGGIQHQKHTSGQLYTEGTQTHTRIHSRKPYNEDAQVSPLSWDCMSYVLYFLVYFYHKHEVARGRVRGVSPQICVWFCVTSCSASRGLCVACFGLCWAVFSNPTPTYA